MNADHENAVPRKPGSKKSTASRRITYRRAGRILANCWQAKVDRPDDSQVQQQLNEALVNLLACARRLPDKPERRKGGSDYRAGMKSEPGLSTRMFGAAYAYQRDPSNQERVSDVVNTAIAYFTAEQSKRERQRRAEEKAEKERKREARLASGMDVYHTGPGELI